MRYGEVVAIVGNADLWCLPCARKQYGSRVVKAVIDGKRHENAEGNYLGVIGYGTEDCYNLDGVKDKQGRMQPNSCGGCHRYIVEDDRQLVLHQGALGMADGQGCYYASYNWNDCPEVSWPDECLECDMPLDDMEVNGCIPDNCPTCGAEMIVQTFETCEECGKPFTHGWQCLDGGEMYCSDCVTVE